MTEYAVDPARMALVNVDMQVAFVEGTPLSAPDGVALLPVVNRLAAACREAGMLVNNSASCGSAAHTTASLGAPSANSTPSALAKSSRTIIASSARPGLVRAWPLISSFSLPNVLSAMAAVSSRSRAFPPFQP